MATSVSFLKRLFLAVLIGGGLWAAFPAGPARAETPITLTGDIKARLVAAPSLSTAKVRDRFNGKPVLVTFFASW